MKKTDLAYMAGLFDGEGCVQIAKSGHYSLACQVSMANEFMPSWFRFSFGGSVHLRPRIGENWKDQWVWTIHGPKAARFLEAILPYLILKKPQAEIGLKFQAGMGLRGRNQYGTNRHDPLTAEELAVREAQFITMKGLNKRGLK